MKLKKLSKTTSANFASVEMFARCDSGCACGCPCACSSPCLGWATEVNNTSTTGKMDSSTTGNSDYSGKYNQQVHG